MRKTFIFLALFLIFFNNSVFSKNELYEKIDLFGEVIRKYQKRVCR